MPRHLAFVPLAVPSPCFAAAPWFGPGGEFFFAILASFVLCVGMLFGARTRRALRLPFGITAVWFSLLLLNLAAGWGRPAEFMLVVLPWVFLITASFGLVRALNNETPYAEEPVTEDPGVEPTAGDFSRARGLCPNCEKNIALDAPKCRYCGALFGPESAWKVTPAK